MQRYARGKLEELHLIDCKPWNKAYMAKCSFQIAETRTARGDFEAQFLRFLSIRLEIHRTSFEEFFDQVERHQDGHYRCRLRHYSDDSLSQISLNNTIWVDTIADWSQPIMARE